LDSSVDILLAGRLQEVLLDSWSSLPDTLGPGFFSISPEISRITDDVE
jgi:hypothetical protein